MKPSYTNYRQYTFDKRDRQLIPKILRYWYVLVGLAALMVFGLMWAKGCSSLERFQYNVQSTKIK